MERSKGIILIVVGLAAILIVWKVAFKPTPPSTTPAEVNQPATPTVPGNEIADAARRPAQQPDDAAADQNQSSRNNRGGRGGNNNMMGGGANQDLPETTLRIVIPDDISDADLRVLADAYMQIVNTGRGGRMGGRTRGGTNQFGGRGGFGGGGMGGAGGFGGGGFGGGGFGG